MTKRVRGGRFGLFAGASGAALLAVALGVTPAAAQQSGPKNNSGSTPTTPSGAPIPTDQTEAPLAAAPPRANGTVVTNSDQRPSSEVSEVVITGQRASIRSSQDIKRNAEQIVDSITAVDIGALPDRSVTEALQRISGVTISRTDSPRDADRISVEGSGVQIRGLSYVRGEINGRDSFGAQSGRTLSFEDIPSELLAGVDVYKNPSADLIEGGLGGTVNLRTRLPFDAKGFVAGYSIDANYADLADSVRPDASLLVSDRWNTPVGEFGLLFDISDSQLLSRTDTISVDPYQARTDLVSGQTVYVPTGFGFRTLTFDRERRGFDAAAQWRPNDQIEVTAQFIRSEYSLHQFEHAIGADSGTTNGPAAGTNFTYDSSGKFRQGTIADAAGGTTNLIDVDDDRYNRQFAVTSDYSLNLKWHPNDKWDFSADVQYVKAKQKQLDFTAFNELTSPAGTVDLTGGLPQAKFGAPTAADLNPAPGVLPNNPADLASYYYDAAMDYHQDNDAHEWAERADGTYTFGDGWLKSVRFGVRHTDRESITRETPYNWGAISATWDGADPPTVPPNVAIPGSVALYTFPNFFRGDVQLPGQFYAPTNGFVSNYNAAAAALVGAERGSAGAWVPFNGDYADLAVAGGGGGGINTQTEETWGGYGLLRFGHDFDAFGGPRTFDGNVGLRIVSTSTTALGRARYPIPGNIGSGTGSLPAGDQAFINGATTDISGGRDYINWLPSLNLRLKVTSQLQFRIAASKAIVRPDFSQLEPTVAIGASTGLLTNGACSLSNPNNLPATCVHQYTANAGNPDLKPIRANQYDFSAEWYFSRTGSVTAALFYKDLYNFITTSPNYVPLTNNGATEQVLVTQPYNAGHGEIRGVELDYTQYYDFLPGFLKGIGLTANYTFVDSYGGRNAAADPYDTTQIANANPAQVTLPLEGLSKNSFNISGLYDYGPWSAKISYNWRQRYLLTTSAANINIPAWFDDFGQVDMSAFYTVNQHVKLGFEINNLTDARTRISVTYPSSPQIGYTGHNYVDVDRRYALVLRGTF